MVKKKVGGAQRYKRAAAAGGGDAGGQGTADGPRPPQHVQRKISRKVKFLERVAASQKALASASGGVSKKRKRTAKPLPTLDSLAGALDEVAQKKGSAAAGGGGKGGLQADRGRGSSVKRLKVRRAIALSETTRVHAVKQHPSFKADPLAAIAHHLQATLPPPPKPVADSSKAKGARRGGAKKKKGAQHLKAGDGMIE